jgi:hypothetical protein
MRYKGDKQAITTPGTTSPRLENARSGRMIGPRRVGVYVQACGSYFRRDRLGCAAQWLQQVRSVLGRLDAIATVLQIGPLLSAPLYPRRSSPLALPKTVLYVWSMIRKKHTLGPSPDGEAGFPKRSCSNEMKS